MSANFFVANSAKAREKVAELGISLRQAKKDFEAFLIALLHKSFA